jgi:hypothetical protein
MDSKIAPAKEPQFLFLLSFLAFLELSISGLGTLFISPDPKKAFLFGFSVQRLLLVAGIWILAIIVLGAGVAARKKKLQLDSAWLVNKNRYLRQTLYGISIALILWGWLSLVSPPYLFANLNYIYERTQPFSVALGVCLAQSWLFYLYARGRLGFRVQVRPAVRKYYRPIILFAIVLIGIGIFMATTKFGLPAKLMWSNVPGIPLSGLQLFFILLLVGMSLVFVPDQQQDGSFLQFVKRYQLIPILIFLTAFLAWGLTPMKSSVFSLSPAAPTYQPIPFYDARIYDVAGISVFRGYGINYHNNENPLFVVFMAILHFLAGFDYKLMTWLQVLVLAFIPVIFFLLGKKFHSTAFGVFLALVLIIRQRNAIVLSTTVSSVNPKLFMSEEMGLLGVALFVYLVFTWIRGPKIWLATLCGGCIGFVSLIRLNSLVLFPAVACLIVPALWGMGKKFVLRHLLAYTIAFLILLIPWMFSTVNSQGMPYLFFRIKLIIDQRYSSFYPSPIQSHWDSRLPDMEMASVQLDGQAASGLQFSSPPGWITNDFAAGTLLQGPHTTLMDERINSGGLAYRVLYHYFHNFSTSVMSMPDSLINNDLNHLTKAVYWSDSGGWQGNLPVTQIGLIFLNLLLIAIGLGYSWARYRWAGMLPLVIFITISAALGAALNSGGRYLTPIDWVIYFYYGLAIVAIVQFALKVLTGKSQDQLASLDKGTAKRISDRRSLGFSLAGIICVASLIPIANYVLPVLTVPARNQAELEAARASISTQEQPAAKIVYGEILYPYYVNGQLTFDFVTPSTDTSYTINLPLGSQLEFSSGEYGFIILGDDVQGHPQLESIYLWQVARPIRIWNRQP